MRRNFPPTKRPIMASASIRLQISMLPIWSLMPWMTCTSAAHSTCNPDQTSRLDSCAASSGGVPTHSFAATFVATMPSDLFEKVNRTLQRRPGLGRDHGLIERNGLMARSHRIVRTRPMTRAPTSGVVMGRACPGHPPPV